MSSTQIILLGVLYLLALAGAHQAHLWWVATVESYRLRGRSKSDHNQASDDAQEADDMDYDQGVLPLQERQYPELLRRLRETARQLARERGEITSDDVHEAHPIPLGIDPRIMGGVFHPRSEWERTGQKQSKRRDQNHGRYVSTWRLRGSDEAAA